MRVVQEKLLAICWGDMGMQMLLDWIEEWRRGAEASTGKAAKARKPGHSTCCARGQGTRLYDKVLTMRNCRLEANVCL